MGQHLKPLKEKQKISYHKFYKRSGVNTGDIIKYENGETSPSFITIMRLAIGLKIHATALIDFGIDFNAGLE